VVHALNPSTLEAEVGGSLTVRKQSEFPGKAGAIQEKEKKKKKKNCLGNKKPKKQMSPHKRMTLGGIEEPFPALGYSV
jgi:glycine cleavage system aminomethyltransferase T